MTEITLRRLYQRSKFNIHIYKLFKGARKNTNYQQNKHLVSPQPKTESQAEACTGRNTVAGTLILSEPQLQPQGIYPIKIVPVRRGIKLIKGINQKCVARNMIFNYRLTLGLNANEVVRWYCGRNMKQQVIEKKE